MGSATEPGTGGRLTALMTGRAVATKRDAGIGRAVGRRGPGHPRADTPAETPHEAGIDRDTSRAARPPHRHGTTARAGRWRRAPACRQARDGISGAQRRPPPPATAPSRQAMGDATPAAAPSGPSVAVRAIRVAPGVRCAGARHAQRRHGQYPRRSMADPPTALGEGRRGFNSRRPVPAEAARATDGRGRPRTPPRADRRSRRSA